MAATNQHPINPWELTQKLMLPTAQAAAFPLCAIEPLSDCNFRMVSGFFDLSDDAGILNCKVSGAKFIAPQMGTPILIIGRLRSGNATGRIGNVRVNLGSGDTYVIAPNWGWSLNQRRCEQQLLLFQFNKNFCMEHNHAAQRKFDRFFKSLPWDVLVKIASTEQGREFICSSLFGKGAYKPSFTSKVFLKILKNAQKGDLLLKHIAHDLGCSMAAVSQVRIAKNTSVSKWQREIRTSLKTRPFLE